MLGQSEYSEEQVAALSRLSHSGVSLCNSCARRYELDKFLPHLSRANDADSIDLVFGQAWGAGMAALFLGGTLDEALLAAAAKWNTSLDAFKKKKNFGTMFLGLAKGEIAVKQLLLSYEVVEIEGVPAAELSLRLSIGDGFYYRGYIDILLMHKETRELVVLDNKTTSFSSVDESVYGNSGQALSYSIVCDTVAKRIPDLRYEKSLTVLYLVFLVGQAYGDDAIQIFSFRKGRLLRAVWLKQLLLEVAKIQLYISEGLFPLNGDSCFNYFSRCPYYGTCTMNTDIMIQPATFKLAAAQEAKVKYQFEYTLEEVLVSQLED